MQSMFYSCSAGDGVTHLMEYGTNKSLCGIEKERFIVIAEMPQPDSFYLDPYCKEMFNICNHCTVKL